MRTVLVMCASLLAGMTGCIDDTHEYNPGYGFAERLLAGESEKEWLDFYRSGLRGDGTVFAITIPCYVDDLWVFRRDGTFEWNEGASKCNEADPYVYSSGNWRLSSDSKYIEFSNVAGDPSIRKSFKFEVVELTDEKLSVRIPAKELFVSTTNIEQRHTLFAE
ncbi:hypothetical protein ACXYMU_20265 [Pontibacter sp. CAU 1760]